MLVDKLKAPDKVTSPDDLVIVTALPRVEAELLNLYITRSEPVAVEDSAVEFE